MDKYLSPNHLNDLGTNTNAKRLYCLFYRIVIRKLTTKDRRVKSGYHSHHVINVNIRNATHHSCAPPVKMQWKKTTASNRLFYCPPKLLRFPRKSDVSASNLLSNSSVRKKVLFA